MIRHDAFAEWARASGWEIPEAMGELAKQGNGGKRTAAPGNSPHWPNHKTKKLEALRLAALKFWGPNYDPAQPDTAPKNETVIEWLQREHGIGVTPATEMASILRPETLRTGPR